jgi:hypothetical protein
VHPRTFPRTFQIYCHADSRCSLKIDREEQVLEFEEVSQAIRAVVELKRAEGEAMLTVYSALGKVVFQAVV